jgi:2'-5' RNA ligase
MRELRRAFLAVVPPPAVIRWTEATAVTVQVDDLRWSRREQRHLTLRFLGPVPDVDALSASVADAMRGHAPFALALGGGGAFPDARHASVLWLGVREGSDELTALAESLGPLDRPYRAHLTLARVAKARDLRDAITALDACGDSEQWTVDEIVLYESDGSRHTEQARFRLVGC